jgi:Predicted permeases
MMEILQSLSGVFSCMLMIGVGFYLSSKKWFDQSTAKLFSKMAMTLTIPLYMIVSMMKSYTKADLMQLGVVVTVPLVTMLITFVVGIITSYVCRIPDYRQGTFRCMFFVANTAFIGFPVNVALFGDKALPYAVMYYLVQSLLFWTIGTYAMSLDGPKMVARGLSENDEPMQSPKIFSMQTIKNIMTPPLIGAMVAILLIVFDVKLPKFLSSTFASFGGMTTPLAMLFIGISIFLVNLRSIRLTFDVVILIAARFIIAPAIIVITCYFIEVPDLMRKVFIIEAAMPVMTQCSIAARAFKADHAYVAVVTAVTTCMSLITIPTFFILLSLGII